jgi:hypothetical protein
LVEGSIHVDRVPQDDGVDDQAKGAELILLALAVALAQFTALAVEDTAGGPCHRNRDRARAMGRVALAMAQLSYQRHRFPPSIIQQAVWLYLRFTLSYRDVEDLLAERGLDISYETVRRWVLKIGPLIARKLRQRRPRPSNRWHLDGVSRTRF